MKIPKQIRIGSCDYEVIQDKKPLIMDCRKCKGIIDYEFHKIDLDVSAQDAQGLEQTFLHELVHGIIRERNLELSKCDDETIVDEIAIGLHQVIRDNPKIFTQAIEAQSCMRAE